MHALLAVHRIGGNTQLDERLVRVRRARVIQVSGRLLPDGTLQLLLHLVLHCRGLLRSWFVLRETLRSFEHLAGRLLVLRVVARRILRHFEDLALNLLLLRNSVV